MLLHGWIQHPKSIVLTPKGYRDSFHSPTLQHYLRAILSHYSMLFVGYSLSDWDMKFFLDELEFAFGPAKIPHFALLPGDKVNELDVEYYREKYGIQAILYAPTDGHPEVEQFISSVVEHVPAKYMRDPLLRLDEVASLEANRTTMSPSEYIRKFRETCVRVARFGFLRTAWTALDSELRRAVPAISTAERAETMIALMEMRIADNFTDLAYPQLHDLVTPDAVSEIEPTLRLRLEEVVFRVCIDSYLLAEAEEALRRAQTFAAANPQVESMAAQLGVGRFLHNGSMNGAESARTAYECGVREELRAMRGGAETALSELGNYADDFRNAGSPKEAAWLRLKRAEILLADYRCEEAWDELEQIQTLESSLSITERATFGRNRAFLGAWLGRTDSDRQYYAAADQTRAGDQQSRLHDLISAEDASRRQEHFNSLPPLWRELVRSFEEGDWGRRSRAHDRLAIEVLSAGWVLEAVHHTILGDNEIAAERLANSLTLWRDANATDAVLSYIVDRCFLARHIKPAAKIIGLMADVIPENRMPDVLAWIEAVMRRPAKNVFSEQCLIVAWEAAKDLCFRLSVGHAHRLLSVALEHPFLKAPGWGRNAAVKLIAALVHRIEEYDWTGLAKAILSMATISRWDGDFDSVLALLRKLAARNPDAKGMIADALLPRRTPVRGLRIAGLAAELGREISPEYFRECVQKITNVLPLQVWEGAGEPPAFVLSSFGSRQGQDGDRKFRVMVFGGAQELDFLVTHKDRLLDLEKTALFESVLDLLDNPLNLRGNRISLIKFLILMRDVLTIEQRGSAILYLRRVASGQMLSSLMDPPKPSTTDRIRFETESPEELQATAIHAICMLAFRAYETTEWDQVLKEAFLHAHPAIRRAACLGTMEVSPTRELEILLVTATQDADESVAVCALHAATALVGRDALKGVSELLTVEAERCFSSLDPRVRRGATRLADALVRRAEEPNLKTALSGILNAAKEDLHFTIRSAAGVLEDH